MQNESETLLIFYVICFVTGKVERKLTEKKSNFLGFLFVLSFMINMFNGVSYKTCCFSKKTELPNLLDPFLNCILDHATPIVVHMQSRTWKEMSCRFNFQTLKIVKEYCGFQNLRRGCKSGKTLSNGPIKPTTHTAY
ncbi:hypothetical protein SCA6_018416 [Theobroma cacao]